MYDWEWRCLALFVQYIQHDLGSSISANLLFPLENISFLDHIPQVLGAKSHSTAKGSNYKNDIHLKLEEGV